LASARIWHFVVGMSNPLCPILALLTLSPHPLKPADVARVLDLPEHDVAMALALLGAAKRAVVVDDAWTAVPTVEVLSEAVGALRAQHRARWIATYSQRLSVLDIGARAASMAG
jgi:hypothetical protein